MVCCCLLDYGVFLSSLVQQEVDTLPRGMKSAFSLRQKSSATSYHSLPITSVLRAIVDDLRHLGRHGSQCYLTVFVCLLYRIRIILLNVHGCCLYAA